MTDTDMNAEIEHQARQSPWEQASELEQPLQQLLSQQSASSADLSQSAHALISDERNCILLLLASGLRYQAKPCAGFI